MPVRAGGTCAALAQEVQRVVVLTPDPFRAVGIGSERFDQCTDEEVRRLLAT